jgi:D-alanyl-D-alanine carboxypeptidase
MFKYSVALIIILIFSVSIAPAQRSPVASRMDKLASGVYRPGGPGAAIIVVKDGRVIFRKGYGLANLELKTAVRPEMVFRLASVTKQFTAVAVMMLVEQGKLSLDDKVTKLLPDSPAAWEKITVEDLLTHTSGIKDYLEKIWPDRMREDMGPRRLMELFKDDPLEFEPGTRELYSNSNYVLLGLIIEKLSGRPYGDFIEQNIFRPLGMKHSYYETVQQIIPDRVSGYAKTDEGYVNAAYVSMPQLYAAGALDSSVDDLAIWNAAIDANKLLKPASWQRIFTRYKFKNGETSDFAFGWAINGFQGETIQSHGGSIPGVTNFVLRLPKSRVYVAILANDRTMEIQPEWVAKRLAGLAIGKPVVDEKIAAAPAADKLKAYSGEYNDDTGTHIVMREEGGRLYLQGDGDPEVEIFPVGDDKFIVRAFDGKVAFNRGPDGKVSSMTVQLGDKIDTLKKIK